MTITFQKAQRKAVPAFVGIAGPTGSGKTYSALRLATGLADGGMIAMVDTEHGRGLHYADKFDYAHGAMEPPFSPSAYAAALDDAAKAGARVLIIDSASHMHEGDGGLLDMHEAQLDKMAGQDWGKRERVKMAAWIRPKADYKAFVQKVLRLNMHVIMCFRAQEKLAQVKNAQGKTEIVSTGLQPICPKGLDFEMMAMLVLPPGAKGVPDVRAEACKLSDDHAAIFKPGEKVNEDQGRRLLEWCGYEPAAPAAAPATTTADASGYTIQTSKGPKTVPDLATWVEQIESVFSRCNPEQARQFHDLNAQEIQRLMNGTDDESVAAANVLDAYGRATKVENDHA